MTINGSNVRSAYITTDQDFYISPTTGSLGFMYITYSLSQATINFFSNLVKIDNLVSASGNPINIGALNCIGTLNMNNNSIINCPSLGGSITGSNSINVNIGGNNFLKKSNST